MKASKQTVVLVTNIAAILYKNTSPPRIIVFNGGNNDASLK